MLGVGEGGVVRANQTMAQCSARIVALVRCLLAVARCVVSLFLMTLKELCEFCFFAFLEIFYGGMVLQLHPFPGALLASN